MATIAAHHARAALGGLIRSGRDGQTILRATGLPPKVLQLQHSRIDAQPMTALVQAIWEEMNDEFMGFTASPCKRGAFAFMARTAHRCDTLGEALQTGIEFYQLLTDDIRNQLVQQDDSAHIRVSLRRPELDPDHFLLEFWLIIWHRFASWLIDTKIPLQHTCLVHQSPAHANELHIMFPGPLQLGNTINQLSFHRDYLQRPIRRSDVELTDFLQNAPADLLTIPGDDTSLQRRINLHLMSRHATGHNLKFPDLRQLARHFNTSPQTLNRKLKQEGTSYQRIKDNIRRDMALQKLIREKRSVNEVAELVGFSEARSFTRAFRLWTGLSPREYCKLFAP